MMIRFLYQFEYGLSLIGCDKYYNERSLIYCDESFITSFIDFRVLALNEPVVLAPRDTYKIIEEYRSLSDLPLDTTLLAV